MHCTLPIDEGDVEGAVDRIAGRRSGLDRFGRGVVDDGGGIEGGAAGFAEAYGGGLVPDDVARSEDLDEHDHVDGVEGAIEAAAEDRADVVARAPRQRHVDADLAEVGGDVVDPRAHAAVGREEVQLPAQPAGGGRFRHRPAFYDSKLTWQYIDHQPAESSSRAGCQST